MKSTRYVFIALCVLAAINALLFTASTAVPLPSADAWSFIDSFVRQALAGQLQVADFFAQRGPGDHAQPLHRLVLLGHLRLADLDFRVEAIVGIALGVVTCSLLALGLVAGAKEPREQTLALLGAAALFAVGLSLNATNLYTWSLVSLGWISLFVAVAYWRLVATPFRSSLYLPVVALATFVVASVLDELAIPTLAAAIAAVVLRDGFRNPRRAVAFAVCGGAGLIAGRWLIHAMASVEGAADATGGSVSALLKVLGSPDAWKILVAPLSDSLVHQAHLMAWFPTAAVPVQVAIALVLAALHLCFWWCVFFRRDRPSDATVVLAVSIMLFFYASIAGIALSRAPKFGVEYFHQPRYAAVYQLNVIALILMFAAPAARPVESGGRNGWLRGVAIAFLVGVLLLQVPLTKAAWTHAKFVHQYTLRAAEALAKLGENPGVEPAPKCPSILTICNASVKVRKRTLALLQDHQLNIYSSSFRHAYGLDRLQVGHPARAVSSGSTAPAGCTVSILKRAPMRILPGQPFNRQRNGQSAFWMTVPVETPAFALEFEGERVRTVRRGGVVTYYYDDRQIAAAAAGRALRFDVMCEGKRVNSFEVAVR